MRMWFAAVASSLLLSFSVLGIMPHPWSPATQPSTASQLALPRRDWINVRTDFGAVGDGVADDTTAFANAIAAFSSSHTAAYVLVPPGTYLVDSIGVVDTLHLMGSGKERTILKARTPGTGAGIVRRDSNNLYVEVTVENLQIQGFLYGIDARATTLSEFRNIYIRTCGTGIYMGTRAGETVHTIWDTFTAVRVTDSTNFTMDVDTSVPVGDQVNACQFHSCVFDMSGNATPTAIRLRGLGGNGSAGNSFHGCTLQNVYLGITGCNGVGWFGGYVEGASIDIGGPVGGVAIHGTYFSNSVDPCVRIGTNHDQNVRGVTIGGCTFAAGDPSQGTGIEIRPDIGGDSSGIVILPNYYSYPDHCDFTPISDPGRVAEMRVTSGELDARGYVTVSSTDARLMSGSADPRDPYNPVSAPVGSMYLRTTTNGADGGALFLKESGSSSGSGWVQH